MDDQARTSHRGRRILAAAAAVVLIGGATVAVTRLADDDSQQVTPGSADPCKDGEDLLALEVGTEAQDPDLFDGFYSLAVTTSGADGELDFLNDPREVVTHPTFSPTGDQVAVVWADGDYESAGPSSESIWVIDRRSGDARPLTTGPHHTAPAWSPDGTLIAYYARDLNDTDGDVRVVPAQGGESRSLGRWGWYGTGMTWDPDGHGLVVWSDLEPGGSSEIRRIDLDGTQETIVQLDAQVLDATLIPGGEELLVTTPWPPTGERRHVAVHLDTGDQRIVEVPQGIVRWSSDGQRLYVVDHGQGSPRGVRRAHYDGVAIAPDGPILAAAPSISHLAVGPCPGAATDEEISIEDRPLVRTDWRLGDRFLAVTEMPAPADCQAPECRRIQVKIEAPGWAPPCQIVTGTLRGSELTRDSAPDGGRGDCPPSGDPPPNDPWFPVSLDVTGDRLVVGFTSVGGPTEHTWFTTYGALYVGDAPTPVTPPIVEGPLLSPVVVSPTTIPLPDTAPCQAVDAFGERLASASTVHELPETASPDELADRTALAIRGLLVDSGLGSAERGGEMSMVYRLVVEEVLIDRSDRGMVAGEVVHVPVEFTFDGGNIPGLGELGQIGHDDDQVPTGTGVPAIAFLTDEAAALPDELRLAGPSALAVGCPGGPLTGLVGSGPAWQALTDLDALADAVRD